MKAIVVLSFFVGLNATPAFAQSDCYSHGPVRSAFIYDCSKEKEKLVQQVFLNERKQIILSINLTDSLEKNEYTIYSCDSSINSNQFIESKTYNNNGVLISKREPISNGKGGYIPYHETGLLFFCGSKSSSVKCKYDKYGNIKEAILYREGTTNVEIEKYKIKYIYK